MTTFATDWTRLFIVLTVLLVGASCSSSKKNKVDDTPDAFTLSSSASTAAVDFGDEFETSTTIQGINRPVPISITGGMYKIGVNGTYTDQDGVVENDQVVYVKLTASTFALDKATATLTVNKTSASFSVTTKVDDVPPEVTIGTPPTTEEITGNSVTLSGTASDPQSGLSRDSVVAKVNDGDPIEAGFSEGNIWFVELPLIIGENTVVVTVTDNNGVQTISDPIIISKADDAPPVLSITSHQNNGAVTGAAISVSGTAIDEHNSVASVSVTINNQAEVQAILDTETGAWSAVDLPINIGANTLSVVASDSLGNTTPIQTLTLNKADDVIPTVTFTAPADAVTVVGQSVTVTGTSADVHSAVASVSIKINAGDETPATLTAATGAWTASLPLTIGTNTVTVYSTDAAGNKSENKILTLNKLDDIAPTLAITAPANAATVTGENTTVTGTVSDAHSGVQSVSVSNNEGAAIVATITEGAWSATVPIIIGTNAISVTASDVQGLQTTQSVTVSKDDDVPPSVAFSTPAADAIVSGQSVTVTGTSSDVHSTVASVTIKINTGEETPATLTAATGAWTASLPLTIGTNTITVYSTDALGNNSASEVLSVTKEDDVAPTVAIATPTAGATVTGDTTAVSGTASDVHSAVASVTLTVNASNVATTLNTDGTWSATAPIQIGANTITASSTDAKGNVSESVSITVNKEDDVPPTAEIKFPPPVSMTEGATVFVRGEADDEHSDIASVTVNGQEAAVVAVVDGPDTWSVEVSLPEVSDPVTAMTITVVVTDSKGNVNDSEFVSVTRDVITSAFPWGNDFFGDPYDVVIDESESGINLYISDLTRKSIVGINLSTSVAQNFSDNIVQVEDPFYFPSALAIGKGRVYSAELGEAKIYVVDMVTNQRSIFIDESTTPELKPSATIAYVPGDSDALYVADNRSIFKVDMATKSYSNFSDSFANLPNSDIPLTGVGSLYYDSKGERLLASGASSGEVYGIALADGSRSVVFDQDLDYLFRFESAGNVDEFFVAAPFDSKVYKVNVSSGLYDELPSAVTVPFQNASENAYTEPRGIATLPKLGFVLIADQYTKGVIATDKETGWRVILSKSATGS